MMDCAAVRAELPAYMAGELDQETTDVVERHISECRRCAQELDELRAVVDVLAHSPVSHEPSRDLEDRVFAAVELEPVAAMVAAAPVEHEPPVDLERRALQHSGIIETRGSIAWPRVRAALVPGLAVATVVLGALGFNWRGESAELRSTMDAWRHRYGAWGQSLETFRLAGLSDPSADARAELVRSPHNNYTLVLWIDSLGTVASGYHYEVWLAGPNGRVPAGSFRVEAAGEVIRNFSIGVDPRAFPTVQVTLEPDAGNPAVTGPTVMEAELDLTR